MRDTKDIADAVFRIRDEHLARQRQKRIRIEKACAAASVAAALVIITAGAVHFGFDKKRFEVNEPDSIAVTTDMKKDIVTTVSSTSASAPVATHTTAAVAASGKNVTSAAFSETKGTTSVVSSAATKTGDKTITTVSTAVRTAVKTDTPRTQTQVTTDINDIDCEEVIRMKVINVKRYLAAVSAAAMAAGAANMPVYAESPYSPKALDPNVDSIIYIEENADKLDFDGSGKFGTMDAYALFTYVNEPEALPEGYGARCKAYGDINSDGKIDHDDSDMLNEYCVLSFSPLRFNDFSAYREYIIQDVPELFYCRDIKISPDAPEEIRKKLLNEFVTETYTYGSADNIKNFVDYCYTVAVGGSYPNEATYDKYDDVYFKIFSDKAKKDKYSFDVNEDGVVDLKDLYDIYIYDVASADEGGRISKDFYFGRFNYINERIDGMLRTYSDPVNTLRVRLPMSEEFKDKLWNKCEPMYEYVFSVIDDSDDKLCVCSMSVYDLIARYIMENTHLDLVNTSTLYYEQYHECLELCGHSVSEQFIFGLKSILFWNFDNANYNKYDPDRSSPKYHSLIADYPYMNDNDVLRAVNKQAQEEFESGLTRELYDINKDGKVDYLDSYTFDLFMSDLANGVSAENSLIPADQWNFLDQKVDLDHDGFAGTFVDMMIFEYIAGFAHSVPEYMLDIYYLQLIEAKGLADISDIKPYIEKLCKDKEAGDVDFDGMVTAVDASYVLSYYAETALNAEVSTVTQAQMQYMADLNDDGRVNSLDASDILSTYAENSVNN